MARKDTASFTREPNPLSPLSETLGSGTLAGQESKSVWINPQAISATPSEPRYATDTTTAAADLAGSDPAKPLSSSSASSSIPRALRRWDRYEVLELLGVGGMGAVYKARDLRLNRLVALKIIHPRFGFHSSAPAAEALMRRFQREARLQASLEHPHICKVFEIGEIPSEDEIPGCPYIAMQLIAGQPLHRAQAEMSSFDKIRVMQLVAEALHAAHSQGLIHRDIKPSAVGGCRSRRTSGYADGLRTPRMQLGR